MKKTLTSISDDITIEYISRLKNHEDGLGLIIKGHLLIEFIINRIIFQKCKEHKIILNDNRSYPFAVKLQLVYSMDLLPHYIYLNIQRINKIRNQLAHNLEIEFDDLDFKFIRKDGKETIIKMRKNKRYPERHYVKLLCLNTLIQLRNHYFLLFGEFPKYVSYA